MKNQNSLSRITPARNYLASKKPKRRESVQNVVAGRSLMPEFIIYRVTSEELGILESGGRTSNYLTYGASLLSIAITLWPSSLLSGLSTAWLSVFIVLTGLFGGAGLILLLVWWNERKALAKTVADIRSRLLD
jgi:sulfite exporter TauE/SafE